MCHDTSPLQDNEFPASSYKFYPIWERLGTALAAASMILLICLHELDVNGTWHLWQISRLPALKIQQAAHFPGLRVKEKLKNGQPIKRIWHISIILPDDTLIGTLLLSYTAYHRHIMGKRVCSQGPF